MCGIVGAVAQRSVAPILIQGLQRLEYRGYDSAGVAVIDDLAQIQRRREVGKVANLSNNLAASPVMGSVGIAHTGGLHTARWRSKIPILTCRVTN
ncbi:MAG: hypothetical protein CM15mP68_7830 [Pseudomonadota bacterium]|nr:MAG: hypothetical protein CM15mP68_7830 [Pseudomonadota bacterium]